MTVTLDQPLELPCGATLKNRLGKSAMSETLGTTDNRVTARLTRLYRAWARGGTGLSVTGNVMIDRRALGEPCNVVLEDRRDMDRLKAWARAGRENGTHLWMQINHPGKQAPAALNRETVSPSAVPFSDPNLKRFFHVPRALTVAEIEALVRRFGETAALAKEAGFSGVQIHGAHGYLVSQFLSPRHNRREDAYWRQRRKPAPLRAGRLRRDPPPGGRRLPGIDQTQLGGLPGKAASPRKSPWRWWKRWTPAAST